MNLTKLIHIVRCVACTIAVLLLASCFNRLPNAADPRSGTPDTAPTPTPAATANPYPWTDENAIVSGICFEAALDAAGDVFVIRTPEDHIRFYGLADNSGLCRHPVTRNPFDFADGHVLAGLWSAGTGCTARHDVLDYRRDDQAQQITINLRFVTEGDCPYELVRPFWIGLDADDYAVIISVEE